MFRLACALLVAAFTVAGCGSTLEERGISGAGIGAGAGAVVGAVTGLSVVEGALIGAAVGGATGLFTDESQINLGDPAWKKKSSEMVRGIQSDLAMLGYDPGPVDGKRGPKTRDAIMRYQKDHKLLADGKPSPELAQHIRQQLQKTGSKG